jgi:hypothetical protein
MGSFNDSYCRAINSNEVLTTLTVVLNINDGNMLFASHLGTKRPHGHPFAGHVHAEPAVETFSLVTQILSSLTAYPSREFPHHGGDQQCTFKVSADRSFPRLKHSEVDSI